MLSPRPPRIPAGAVKNAVSGRSGRWHPLFSRGTGVSRNEKRPVVKTGRLHNSLIFSPLRIGATCIRLNRYLQASCPQRVAASCVRYSRRSRSVSPGERPDLQSAAIEDQHRTGVEVQLVQLVGQVVVEELARPEETRVVYEEADVKVVRGLSDDRQEVVCRQIDRDDSVVRTESTCRRQPAI